MIRIGADEEFYPHTHTYTWQPTRRATKAAGLSKEGSDLRLKGKAQRSGAFRVQRVEQSKAERKPRRVLSEDSIPANPGEWPRQVRLASQRPGGLAKAGYLLKPTLTARTDLQCGQTVKYLHATPNGAVVPFPGVSWGPEASPGIAPP